MTTIRRFAAGAASTMIVEDLSDMGYAARLLEYSKNKDKAWAVKKPGARRESTVSWRFVTEMADRWRIKNGMEPILK